MSKRAPLASRNRLHPSIRGYSRSSIVGVEEVVACELSISLGAHPVTEEEGGEERDERDVVAADAVDHEVDVPADEPGISENCLNVLYSKYL